MNDLFLFINLWKGKRFVWGEFDCIIAISDWVKHVRGVDPARHVRGTYASLAGAQQVAGWVSDPVGAATGLFEGVAGLKRVNAISVGDVAILDVGERLPVGGIYTGDGWAINGEEGAVGVSESAARPLAVWGVGYAA